MIAVPAHGFRAGFGWLRTGLRVRGLDAFKSVCPRSGVLSRLEPCDGEPEQGLVGAGRGQMQSDAAGVADGPEKTTQRLC